MRFVKRVMPSFMAFATVVSMAISCPAAEPSTGKAPAKAEPKPETKPDPKAEAIAAEVAKLVKQLGDENWDLREAAQKRLAEIGKPAVAALREALGSKDMEVTIRAKTLLAEIVGQGFLGIHLREVEAEERQGDVPKEGGSMVVEILPENAAAKAGLEAGDVLYSLDGKVLNGVNGTIETVSATAPGTESKLVIYRQGKKLEKPITMGRRPKSADQ